MPMQSPGGAFSNAMEDQLMKHETAKRQAMLDSLSIQREADLAKYREDEIKIRRDEAAQRAKQAANSDEDRDRAKLDKRVGNMVPGDIPDPQLLKEDARLGGGYFPVQSLPAVAPVPQSAGMQVPGAVGADTGLPANPAGTPLTPPDAPAALQPPPQAVFIGNRTDRLAADQRARQQAFVDSLPEGDPRKVEIKQSLEAEAAGLKVPPGFFSKTTASDNAPVMRQNTVKGTVERLLDGTWQTWSGDVPKGAHWMTEPQPKDTSASDAAHTAAKDRHLDQVHQTAVTELNKRAVPYESHIQSINDLGMMLNAKTPQADALIAPLVLKATVSGAGTGFRMTQSEINQVVGGRSKWESLQAALNKWSTDPSQALSITDEQRTELRSMAKAIRAKAYGMQQKVTTTRQALDDATTPQEIHKLMTKLQNDLSAGEMASAEDTTPADGVPVVGGTFQGGRVLSITPVKK